MHLNAYCRLYLHSCVHTWRCVKSLAGNLEFVAISYCMGPFRKFAQRCKTRHKTLHKTYVHSDSHRLDLYSVSLVPAREVIFLGQSLIAIAVLATTYLPKSKVFLL